MAVKKKIAKKKVMSKKTVLKKSVKKAVKKTKPKPKKARGKTVKTKSAKKVAAKKKTAPKKTAKKVAAKKPAAKKQAKQPVKKAKPAPKAKVKPKAKAPAKPKVKAKSSKKESPGKTRYADSELVEFKKLIMDKLEGSRKELKYLHEQINRTAELGGDDSDTKFTGLEDGTGTSEKEYLSQMASRQIQYIDHLEKALVRIANKTYGVCRVTGKLISKERLRAVPHATLSIEAKKAQSAA